MTDRKKELLNEYVELTSSKDRIAKRQTEGWYLTFKSMFFEGLEEPASFVSLSSLRYEALVRQAIDTFETQTGTLLCVPASLHDFSEAEVEELLTLIKSNSILRRFLSSPKINPERAGAERFQKFLMEHYGESLATATKNLNEELFKLQSLH